MIHKILGQLSAMNWNAQILLIIEHVKNYSKCLLLFANTVLEIAKKHLGYSVLLVFRCTLWPGVPKPGGGG